MANSVPLRSGEPSRAASPGSAWNRSRGSGFEWVAPQPSPEVVAELERKFPAIVQVPELSLEAEEGRWASHAIIARCLSRWIPPEIMVREFHRAGLPGEIEALALANKHYIFQFSDIRAKTLALGRPWVIHGQPIITSDWIPEFVPADSTILSALLWIRLPQLPIEFWNDDILASILAVAGQFLFSDDSTKARKRGSFARACVRVDLSKALRPGARIRGSRSPFWQQFSYENLEGICSVCGTVHLSGSCQLGPESDSSSSDPGYGPWMAAIRRRRSPPNQQLGERNNPPSSSSVLTGGWQLPKKMARRMLSKGSVLHPPLEETDSLLEKPHAEPLGPLVAGDQGSIDPNCQVKGSSSVAMDGGRPVPVGTVAQSQFATVPVTEEVILSNPFACLDESLTVRPKPREDGSSTPSKRTWSAELVPQRMSSRPSKGKGKAPVGGKACSQGTFTFQASVDSSGARKRKSRRKEGPGMGSASGLPLPDQMEVGPHDSAVLLLKKAILRGKEVDATESSLSVVPLPRVEEVDAKDSSHLEDSSRKGPILDAIPDDDHSVDDVMGDRSGPPSTRASE